MTKMTKHKTSLSKYQDQAKLNSLTDFVVENIESIYQFFGVQYHKSEKLCFSPCFIHGGDNKTALNLYHSADYRVHFKCRTHCCEHVFGTSLISMIRGGLSHVKYGWTTEGDKQVTFDQTVEFLLNHFELDFFGLRDGETFNMENSKSEFCQAVNAITVERPVGTIDRDLYVSKVDIPSKYYVKRGYSKKILKKYDVGDCRSVGKQMNDRALAPVYDEEGQFILGFTGRSIFEKCSKCNSYHDPKKSCHHFPKWKHTKGFQKEKCLYNYNTASSHILNTGVIILVESPGNVWRLEEAGIHNSVAILGTSLNELQRQLIDESGALSIVCIMDNDENRAGQKAAQAIKEQCERSYRVYIVDIDKNDIGDMSTNEVSEDIKPIIDKLKESYT